MRLILLLAFTLGLAFSPFASSRASSFPDRYDSAFEQAAGRWLPGVDWKLLKAQCYQESRLRPDAVSPVGAEGLCQFMPGTWRDMQSQGVVPSGASAFAPALSVESAAYYMGRLRKSWSSPRPERDRHSLALASYNAGLGHLLSAQRRCGGALLYEQIASCLPAVTGRHSRETLAYVDRVWQWWRKMRVTQ